ncbi:amidohydrolase [bacterium]|nr:amidohydrolase [bacterium]
MPALRLVDADAHVVEPPDLWATWLPPRFRDHPDTPKLVRDVEGGDAWQFGAGAPPAPLGIYTAAGKAPEEIKWTGARYDAVRPGMFRGRERLADMDADGVDVAVLFGSARPMGLFLRSRERDFHLAGFRAFNDFVCQDFAAADRRRLVPLAYIPGLGVEAAIAELRRAHAQGARGAALMCWPSAGDTCSPADDPFWAACEELDVPVIVHVRLISVRSAPPPPTGKQGGDLPGLSTTGLLDMPLVIARMIFAGVFERFPRLRAGFIEAGAGWVPYLLQQMDDRFRRNRHWTGCDLSLLPSEYFQRNCKVSFMYDPYAVQNRHACGVETLMWSSDYPHHGTDWPHSRRVIDQTFTGVPEAERHRILAGNCAELFRLEGA